MCENTPIDVNANCLSDGKIIPRWIQLQNEEQELVTLKIKEVVVCKESCPCGSLILDFYCKVDMGERERFLQIRYQVREHKWKLFKVHY